MVLLIIAMDFDHIILGSFGHVVTGINFKRSDQILIMLSTVAPYFFYIQGIEYSLGVHLLKPSHMLNNISYRPTQK